MAIHAQREVPARLERLIRQRLESSRSMAKCSPMVRGRERIRRASSSSSQRATIAFSSAKESTSVLLTELLTAPLVLRVRLR
ncbi:hypothetical protein, partial [Sphaerisporangium flaviroseum]|uniref:hypothetical protein n=1 Tax=Sphaerisporangium flaviroseum TaxID=509199 RepID=UPI0031F08BDD